MKAPARGKGLRTFNVYVGDEYYKVEVEPAGGKVPSSLQTPAATAADGARKASVPKEANPPAAKVQVAAGETAIQAPIPGTIIRFLVKEGDMVNAGTGVVILEAMKMENMIESPVAGKVKSLKGSPGTKVAKDDILVIIG